LCKYCPHECKGKTIPVETIFPMEAVGDKGDGGGGEFKYGNI
jgi:hypothetical protein